MAAITICNDFGTPQNKVCHCFHCFPIYLPWSDGTVCHDLVFWMLSFKPTFSLSSLTLWCLLSGECFLVYFCQMYLFLLMASILCKEVLYFKTKSLPVLLYIAFLRLFIWPPDLIAVFSVSSYSVDSCTPSLLYHPVLFYTETFQSED